MPPRQCRAKIVATLGPASSSPGIIRALFGPGADVFRLNFSQGSHEKHAQHYAIIRRLEQKTGRPIVSEIVAQACTTARAEGLASPGEIIAIAAGMPFGVAATTNLLRIEWLEGDQT